MRFAHLADCHIGSWREPSLRDASTIAFSKAIDIALERSVDFVLISGDLFNTAQPPMEHLKSAVEKLKQCADAGVPVYIIAGSHDYSPSGKTMIDVLDAAGLVRNVARVDGDGGSDEKLQLSFTTDAKTGAKICGIVGRKGSLEKEYFDLLDLSPLESEPGEKILLFHSAVAEFRPAGFEQVEATPLSCFPKGFTYYAGGHIHIVDIRRVEGYGQFGIPGPIFPNTFAEIERLNHGGFIMHDNGAIEHVQIPLFPVRCITIDAHAKTPATVENLIRQESRNIPPGAIVTLRIEGTLETGKAGDIPLGTLCEEIIANGARSVLRNTSKLSSTELAPIHIVRSSVEDIESDLIREHAGQLKVFPKETEEALVKGLMQALSAEKSEGETATTYEERIAGACKTILPGGRKPVMGSQ